MKKKAFPKQTRWSRSCDGTLLRRFDRILPEGKATPYRSGVVPFLPDESGNILVLLITPRKGGRWILPKGNIARGMDSFQSAVKEACEEAGVLGKPRKFLLGIAESAKHEFIEFYPLEITQILPCWEESSVRSRLFFPLEEALREFEGREEYAVLKALQRYIRELPEHSDGNLTEI